MHVDQQMLDVSPDLPWLALDIGGLYKELTATTLATDAPRHTEYLPVPNLIRAWRHTQDRSR